jgi:serine/threonine-protein kinase
MPPPAKIGRYEILAELGQGAMGTVYKARDPMMDRLVAIKVIRITGLSRDDLQRYKQRFQREAMTAGKMSHPGIVTIYDISEDEAGHPYMVMEFVEGDALYNLLRPDEKGRLPQRPPLAKSIDIGIQVAEALAYAHGRGVIHRDIKPANIIVTADGRAKIADFGVAKLTGTEATAATARVVGTPAYMSPEMCTGGNVDARTDIFSLGAMLYWMATGEKPFPGDTISAVAFKVVYEQVVPPRQIDPALSAELETTLVRCLAKNPDQRYPNSTELAKDLTALKTGSRRRTAVAPGIAARTTAMPDLAPVVATVKAKWNEMLPGNWKYVPLGFVVLLLMIVSLGLWLRSSDAGPETEQQAAVTAPAVAPPSETQPPPETETPKPEAKTAPAQEPAAPTGAPIQRAEQPSKPKPQEGAEESLPAAEPKEQPMPAEPPPATQPELAPVESAAPAKPAKVQARPAMATLEIECRHNFRLAKIEIFSSGTKIYSGELAGQSRVLARAAGVLNATAPIRAGEHTLSVRITADRQDYRGEITGTFAEGATRALRIDFGKGSGLGFRGRKLSLSWRE